MAPTAPAPDAPQKLWPSRGQWDAEVRAMYQSGLRFLRLGQHAEAVGCFMTLLQSDPQNSDARELLAIAEQGARAAMAQAVIALPPVQPPARSRRGLLIAGVAIACLVGVALAVVLARDHTPPVQLAGTTPSPDAKPAGTPAPDGTVPVDAAPPADASPPVDAPPPIDAAPAPKPEVFHIEAPTAGRVTAFLVGPRAVAKGEKLFEIVRVTSDPVKTRELAGKLAELQKLARQDPMTYEPFLTKARRDLDNARHVSTTVVKAPRAGAATPQVKQGAAVRVGQILADVE